MCQPLAPGRVDGMKTEALQPKPPGVKSSPSATKA